MTDSPSVQTQAEEMEKLLQGIDKTVFQLIDAIQNADSVLELNAQAVGKTKEYLTEWVPAWTRGTLTSEDIQKRLGTDSILSYLRTLQSENKKLREKVFELVSPRAADGTTIAQQKTVIAALQSERDSYEAAMNNLASKLTQTESERDTLLREKEGVTSVSHAVDILWDECVKNKAKEWGEWDATVDGKKCTVRIQLDSMPSYDTLLREHGEMRKFIEKKHERLIDLLDDSPDQESGDTIYGEEDWQSLERDIGRFLSSIPAR